MTTAQYIDAGHTVLTRSDKPNTSFMVGHRFHQELIDDGVLIADYIAPVPTLAERKAAALIGTEDLATVARKCEDLIDHLVNGAPLDPKLDEWRLDRATKRQNA